MSVRYREPDNDPEGAFNWLLLAFIVFLIIVGPCVCMVGARR